VGGGGTSLAMDGGVVSGNLPGGGRGAGGVGEYQFQYVGKENNFQKRIKEKGGKGGFCPWEERERSVGGTYKIS